MIKKIPPQKTETYGMPTEVIFGRGAFKLIENEEIIIRAKKIVIVAGEHFKQTSSFIDLEKKLEGKEIEVIVYDTKIAKSDFDTINSLTDYFRKNAPEIVIVIGGGTILDTAKCAAILAINGGNVEDYLVTKKLQLDNKGIPLVTVPTTSGTGSEVTPWAVIWDFANHEKHSLSSPLMFPYLAVVDPALTDNLPPKITAETGMDALTQAIEAYWSKFHNPVSDKYALEAIKLVMKYLSIAVNDSTPESRNMMSKASLFAGLAFSNTKTTICHSVSYPMTAHWGVAHGQAVSVTLSEFIRYSLPAMQGRERKLIKALGADSVEEAAQKVGDLMKDVHLATRLSELEIKKEDIPIIVLEGYDPDRANNAPRVPTQEELKLILEEIL